MLFIVTASNRVVTEISKSLFFIMADATYTKPGHNRHNNEQSRRIVPIIPVIPRKFERKSRPTNGSLIECPPPANNKVKSAKSGSSVHTDSFFERLNTARDEPCNSSEEERLVEGERKLRNRDDPSGKVGIHVEIKENAGNKIFETRGEPKSGVEEKEEENLESGVEGGNTLRGPRDVKREEKYRDSLSSPEVIGEGTSYIATTNDLQNSVTEKNGFRLPSPFYPHNSKSFLPPQPHLHIQPHLQYPSTDSNISYPTYPLAEHPSSYYIATPPTDDIMSPTETDYRGYGHIPYARLQPEHTPPTDPTPSPKNDLYNRQTPEILHDVQESSPTANRPPSPCSFYQGYTYGGYVEPKRLSFSVPAPPIHDVSQGNHLPPHRYENMLPLSSDSRSDGRISTKSSINSCKSHKVGTGMSTDTLRHRATKIDDSISECRPSWAHGVSPTSSLGSFHQPYQPTGSELYAGESFAVKYESWRSTTLHSLNQPLTEASPNQTPLTAYLLDQFNKGKYADIRLEVIHERDGLVMADFRLHSVIMAQNKIWQELMNASTSERPGLKLLQLRTNDRFITSQAIEGALRVFYGEPSHLFIGSCLQIDLSKQNADTSLAWMDNALSFAASGYLLGLEEVITRGLHIASSILSWDNIEKALSFALHGGLDPDLDPDHALRVDNLISLAKSSIDSIPSAVRGASGSLRKRARSGAGSRTPQSKAARSRRSSLLFQCLNYIASEFPISWNLEISACPLAEIDRLPLTAKDHSPSNKSRLVSIRFGDCPPEILSIARHRDSVLSSILLSLPFVPLKYILDQLPESTRSRIIRPIVDEREQRRTQILKEGETDWSRRIIDADHLAYVGWKESVISKDSYLALERTWTSFHEPHST